MGVFSSVLLPTHDTTHRMIKSLVLTCLVAAVRADADADAYYSLYGYAGVPFGSSTGLDPITQGLDPVTQGVALPYHGYAGYGYPYYGHYLGKRSADADADAYYAGYPFAYAAHPYAYAGYHACPYAAYIPFGSSTGLDPITQGLDPVTQGLVH